MTVLDNIHFVYESERLVCLSINYDKLRLSTSLSLSPLSLSLSLSLHDLCLSKVTFGSA